MAFARSRTNLVALVACSTVVTCVAAVRAESRLLRQPTVSRQHIAFAYGSDHWIVDREGAEARRVTNTPAVESDPHLSPDGKLLAFTSNRSGTAAVYVMPIEGGPPRRLTWYPADCFVLGWTPDSNHILYASTRASAPIAFERLWTVSSKGGPSNLLCAPWGHDGSFSPDGKRVVVDRIDRIDSEWRHYRGGQNTPLVVLDLASQTEVRLPNENTIDVHPVWLDDGVYFLSDRDWAVNVWRFDPKSKELTQVTHFKDVDVKWLSGHKNTLVLEQSGYIFTLNLKSGHMERLPISVKGEFRWLEPTWEDVEPRNPSVSLSATGDRLVLEARGEVFTVSVADGSSKNLTATCDAADREPIWSPNGQEIAWFSNSGQGYDLVIANVTSPKDRRVIDISESKMAWEPTWSPDAARIAFVDDHARIRIVDCQTENVVTADTGIDYREIGEMGLTWSPDAKWLAYSKKATNNLRRILVWSVDDGHARPLTDSMADAIAPSWDREGKYLFFLASTNKGLSSVSGTSKIGVQVKYTPYLAILDNSALTPFQSLPSENTELNEKRTKSPSVKVDFGDIQRRIVAFPVPGGNYTSTIPGKSGEVYFIEANRDTERCKISRFSLRKRKAEPILEDVTEVDVSSDGTTLLYRFEEDWHVLNAGSSQDEGVKLTYSLRVRLDRRQEWKQMFDETWQYLRDYFYASNLHGRDWVAVRERYAPLVPHLRHRADLNYVLDQMSGELSVGHSFVSGGDIPRVEKPSGATLGVDLVADKGRWSIKKIYRRGSWNPQLKAPLDAPGLNVKEGQYLMAVNGVELTAREDPYRHLNGTPEKDTALTVNDSPNMEGSWTIQVQPLKSEGQLRRQAWVDDNRERVDMLSGGKVAYVWIPDTWEDGISAFNRYYFAQQDKLGAVVDARFNDGGSRDDFMVDVMLRQRRSASSNRITNGNPFQFPAGILGPKVLLINERAVSGGDYLAWIFRRMKVGPLVGMRTWGGLVSYNVYYELIDGGDISAPESANFDAIRSRWIGENQGIAPDIEVFLDADSACRGRDVQLERAVREVLRISKERPQTGVTQPPFSTPTKRPNTD